MQRSYSSPRPPSPGSPDALLRRGDCLEVATHPTAVHIRDSKTPTTPHLIVTPAAWTAFLSRWAA
ncbi:DUF397 domain-containing protein [Streptomyces sp. NPDC058735]|uniref:DUF397 domain-containing protein n=1 Tax=unclassified Streptomyces TaxID=2593676 RepID=UPI0036B17E77